MKKYFLLIFSIFLIYSNGLFAEDIIFSAQAKRVVSVGEMFNLTFTLNSQGKQFRGPQIKNFKVISGPNTSSNSNIRFINGSMSRSETYTFSYVLEATQEGEFNIPSATIVVNKEKYESNSLTIKVVKNKANKPKSSSSGQRQSNRKPQSSQQRNQRQNASKGKHVSVNNKDVFLKALINKKDPYQGEQIVVTYKIYTKVPLSNIGINKLSSFPGFWSYNLLKDNTRLNQYNEYIDGEEYVVADLKKTALFPMKSGELKIEALEMECVAQIRSKNQRRRVDPFFDSFFNDPFFGSYQNVEKTVISEALKVDVKPLPSHNKPVNFSGAVGDFNFKSSINKTDLKVNEALTLKLTVYGKGNIELIDKFNIAFPPDFEVYDPKITKKIIPTDDGITGRRIFEYLIIPRNAGEFTIKPINFSYFNLKTKKYSTISSPEYLIKVEKGNVEQQSLTFTGVNKEEIKYIGSDIRHIKSPPYKLTKSGVFLFGSTLFWLLLIVPFIIFILIIIIWKDQIKKRSDVVLMKNKKATKVSRKRLRKAYDFLKANEKEQFYIEISQALWGYLSDKFSIPRSELSMDSVSEALMKKKVNEEIINQFIQTLNNCEFARFAPGDSSKNMDNIYNEALEIVIIIEKELK
jgi:hypothetical protein